jgi:hypothetical protein
MPRPMYTPADLVGAATEGPMQAVVSRHGSAAAWTAALTLLLLAACSATPLKQPSWSAPADPMDLAAKAGFMPTDREYLVTHTHVHLDVYVDGTPVPVPAGIGIDTKSTGVAASPNPDGTNDYQVAVCDKPCLSELHTHDPDGILHSESKVPENKPAKLGQFFTEWGVRLDGSCVGEFCSSNTSIAVYVDGKKRDGNPADIELKSHLEIAIIIGKPPALIPDHWDFLPGT